MAFHVKRSKSAHLDEITVFNGTRTSRWVVPPAGTSVTELQTFPDPAALKGIPDDKNPLNPPPHWHWYQEEHFTITQGRFIFILEGKEVVVAATDKQPVVIPPGVRHWFKVDPTSPEPCRLEIATTTSPLADGTTAEEDVGLNERFFRNVYGYLEDCGNQKVAPSLPQLVLFLHSVEVSLAFPGPGWLARSLSYAFGVVVGRVVGQYILGYKDSYPEYYDDSRASKKQR